MAESSFQPQVQISLLARSSVPPPEWRAVGPVYLRGLTIFLGAVLFLRHSTHTFPLIRKYSILLLIKKEFLDGT